MRTTESGAEQGPHLVHGVGLAAEVELGSQAAGELVEHLARPHALPERGPPLHEVGHQREGGEIPLHDVLDAGTLDLDHDRLAGAEPGAVGLADRGRGERFPVELREHLVDRLSQLGLEDGLDPLDHSGRTRFWSLASSAASSGEMRSTLVAAIWPSLTETPPASSSSRRRRTPVASVDRSIRPPVEQQRPEPLPPGELQELPVAAQHVDAAADGPEGPRDDDQPGPLAGGQRARAEPGGRA